MHLPVCFTIQRSMRLPPARARARAKQKRPTAATSVGASLFSSFPAIPVVIRCTVYPPSNGFLSSSFNRWALRYDVDNRQNGACRFREAPIKHRGKHLPPPPLYADERVSSFESSSFFRFISISTSNRPSIDRRSEPDRPLRMQQPASRSSQRADSCANRTDGSDRRACPGTPITQFESRVTPPVSHMPIYVVFASGISALACRRCRCCCWRRSRDLA